MRVRHVAPFGAGLLIAFAIVRFPALAADQSITALSPYGWDPATPPAINVSDSVTWTNPGGGYHNVCVRRSNVTSGCAEFHLPATPSPSWPAEVKHQFTSDGTYTFICEQHGNLMKGTIVVGTGENPPTGTGTGTGTSTGTGTGTSTTPPPSSQPTETTTNPTQTEQNTVAPDTTKPAFTGSVKRRASRTALILTLGSSEEGTLKATVFRRPPSRRSFTRISQSSLHVKEGKNVVTLIRKLGKRRSGAFRVTLQLVDAAGNKSAAKTISFKIA